MGYNPLIERVRQRTCATNNIMNRTRALHININVFSDTRRGRKLFTSDLGSTILIFAFLEIGSVSLSSSCRKCGEYLVTPSLARDGELQSTKVSEQPFSILFASCLVYCTHCLLRVSHVPGAITPSDPYRGKCSLSPRIAWNGGSKDLSPGHDMNVSALPLHICSSVLTAQYHKGCVHNYVPHFRHTVTTLSPSPRSSPRG